jgi:uncharacterized membrane protein YfcA
MRHVEPRAQIDWLPGTGLLAVGIGVGAVLGYSFAAGRPPVLLSACVALLMVLLAARHLHRRPGRVRLPFTTSRATNHETQPRFDLVRDRSTDSQKYVM